MNPDKPFPRLKIFKFLVLAAGFILGLIFLGDGFGIQMCMTNTDPSWVLTYSYCLWLVFPLVLLSVFMPRVGGTCLIGVSICSSLLLLRSSFKGMSWGTIDNIFRAYDGFYSVGLTILTIAIPILALGLCLFFIGHTMKVKTQNPP